MLFGENLTAASAAEAWCAHDPSLDSDRSNSDSEPQGRVAATQALNWFLVALKRGEVTLQGLLLSDLGPQLTHASPTVRSRAIDLLALLLARLPKLHLPNNVCHTHARVQKDPPPKLTRRIGAWREAILYIYLTCTLHVPRTYLA